jgi:hypothetical protein
VVIPNEIQKVYENYKSNRDKNKKWKHH